MPITEWPELPRLLQVEVGPGFIAESDEFSTAHLPVEGRWSGDGLNARDVSR